MADYSTPGDQERRLDAFARLRERLIREHAGELAANPRLAELIDQDLKLRIEAVEDAERLEDPPPDSGLSGLIGLASDAPDNADAVRLASTPVPYDDLITPQRIQAIGDLYFIYQHEAIGVFRVALKLQQLFKAGVVRLFDGKGAMALYRFDRRQVLRYTATERQQAYLRAFGYTSVPANPGAMPNRQFHSLFTHFVGEVARFFRDKRISDVIRERANDPSFGSIAKVRRAGLDLRYNLKNFSYGHINVLRIEVGQLLEEAFKVFSAPDVKKVLGADTAWDVVEDVLRRYFGESVNVSPRSRMAITGQQVLNWLAQPHVLNTSRVEFEGLLQEIAEPCEEWLMSSRSVGAVVRTRPRFQLEADAEVW